MRKVFFKALSIEIDEQHRVSLLLLQSLFLGIFMATLEIGANTLFMEVYGEDELPAAFLISGAAGIVLTTIYSKLQSLISFSRLAVLNLIGIALLTCAMRYGFEVTQDKRLIFILFVMMGPLSIMSLLGFWGVVSRIFTLRQGKRIFGMIDSGQVFGTIVISFAIPLILSIMPEIKNLLLISALSIVIALLIQFMINRSYGKQISFVEDNQGNQKAQSAKFSDLLKNPLVVMMSLFVMLSMIGAFFVNYSFLSVTKDNYPNSTDLANFLGVFTATVMIFSFLFKTFVYSKLMETYGLKVSILILPFLLGFFTIIAALVGTFWGYTSQAANFAFFFLLISLGKLFSQSLRTSIEIPAFKTTYQPLDKNIRYDVQAKIDGIVNEFSALTAGVIILALSSIHFFERIHFTYFLVLIILCWIYVSIKLYNEYKGTLRKSLTNIKMTDKQVKEKENEMSFVLNKELNSDVPDKVISTLKITENIEPVLHESSLVRLMESQAPRVREYVLKKADELKLYSASAEIKKRIQSEKSEPIKKIAQEVITHLNEFPDEAVTLDRVSKFAKSKNPDDRVFAAKLIGRLKKAEFVPVLVDLLRDIEPKVKIAAISNAAKLNQPILRPFLIDGLASSLYNRAAASALISIGEDAIENLDSAFYKSGFDVPTLIRILHIYGVIGGQKAVDHLVTKINYPNSKIVSQALISLKACSFLTKEDKVVGRIQQSIESTIGIISWNISAQSEIEKKPENEFLLGALEEEIIRNYEMLYLLLSLLYDAQTITHIRESLESGTSEGIGFAIELLDLFLAEELKPKLFPLLEDRPINDKKRLLQVHFPRENLDSVEVLRHIINRDYNYINRWTKACAIYSHLHIPGFEVTNDLIANLFNPDALLRETSAWVIYKINKEVYEKCSLRLESAMKEELDKKIKRALNDSGELLIERILYLKRIPQLGALSGLILAEIAENLKERKYPKGAAVCLKNQVNETSLYFIVSGKLLLKNEKITITEFGQNNLLGEMLIMDSDHPSTSIVAAEETTVYSLENSMINELMFRYSEFASAYINVINLRTFEESTILMPR